MYCDNSDDILDVNLFPNIIDERLDQSRPAAPETTANEDEEDQHHDIDNEAETLVLQNVPNNTLSDQIREVMNRSTRQQGQQGPPVADDNTIPWPTRSDTPASEFAPGFFRYTQGNGFVSVVQIVICSKAFPHLFPTGAGDLTKYRLGKTPSLLDYIRHLTRLDIEGEEVNRFAKETRFVLYCTNMYLRYVQLKVCRNIFMHDHQAQSTYTGSGDG